MIKIELTSASNGVIKKIIDTQSNEEIFKVYEIPPDSKPESFLNIIDLMSDISEDLGLEMGSDFDPLQINFDVDWGEKYRPSVDEVDLKIKALNAEIKILKDYKKELTENANNV